jgi:hypothetical protein
MPGKGSYEAIPLASAFASLFMGAVFVSVFAAQALAQRAPELGYVFPGGGKAGTTIEVHLGGYDWTPDMDYFVLEPGVQLVADGPPGPILIPPPPYWFGAKGRLPAQPLPREVPARFIIPAGTPPGPIHWQAANANGGTATGVFVVGIGDELVEDGNRLQPQLIASLPATVSGRVIKNEEVDLYRFTAPKSGPVICDLEARRIGSGLQGVMEVRDAAGKVLAESVDAEGLDTAITFFAVAGAEYQLAVRDIDYAGDRSFIYRLTIAPGPRVLAALPAALRRGETREVEFIGVGLATGADRLESLTRSVSAPADAGLHSFDYVLAAPVGAALPFRLLLSDLAETVELAVASDLPHKLAAPVAVTGRLDGRASADRYCWDARQGESWTISLVARRIGSPLDLTLSLLNHEGKELAVSDDLPGTTDAGLDFVVPADGCYQLVLRDVSDRGPSQAAAYRLAVVRAAAEFSLEVPQRLNVLVGESTKWTIKAARRGGWKGPIAVAVAGLPAGVQAPAELTIPADKNELPMVITAAADAVASASLVTVTGTAEINGVSVTRMAHATGGGNLAPRSPEENYVARALATSVMKPRCTGEPVDRDTVRKARRGASFPAEVAIERLEGFAGPIVLKMSSKQSYQVQGITGGDVLVPPGVSRTVYPCFMPEWLETTRTSRMAIIATAEVPDASGRIRHLAAEIKGQVTMTLEGAILSVSHAERELHAPVGAPFCVHVKIARAPQLPEPVHLELRVPRELQSLLAAEPVTISPQQSQADFRIVASDDPRLLGWRSFTIRGTALPAPRLPVLSETHVEVKFISAASQASPPAR